jgi:uncharacterized protein
MRALHCFGAWLVCCLAALAAQIPEKPTKYLNDYAGIVSAQTADRLNRTLEDFEKQTSSQILVVIYPKLPAGAALEDFTLRAAEAWKPGLEKKDNGAILFIFRDDRKMRIEVGYGLEGAIPDLIAKRIIDNEISPRFRSGDFNGGVAAGANALMQAARGEYKGTGTTVASRRNPGKPAIPIIFILLFFLILFSGIRRHGTMYHRQRRPYWGGWIGGLGSGLGGGSWGGSRGGSSSWGGGGGFSGGGGRFGGGGASGGW